MRPITVSLLAEYIEKQQERDYWANVLLINRVGYHRLMAALVLDKKFASILQEIIITYSISYRIRTEDHPANDIL